MNSKVEQLKKRAATRPDWKDLMEEIGSYKNSYGKLKKTQCNDRSRPVLTATKIGKSVSKFISWPGINTLLFNYSIFLFSLFMTLKRIKKTRTSWLKSRRASA